MSKKSFLSIMFILLFAVTSCHNEEAGEMQPGETITGDAGKTLIVYFSWGGNTRAVAGHIHDLIGGGNRHSLSRHLRGSHSDCSRRVGERLSARIENESR